jgi:hypothetical protein
MRELLNWTTKSGQHHEIVATPSASGNVCYVSYTHNSSATGSCIGGFSPERPLLGGLGAYDTGSARERSHRAVGDRSHIVYSLSGVASDDVRSVEVVAIDGSHSAAHMGMNAYWWERSAQLAKPRYLDVILADGSRVRTDLQGVRR